LSDFAAPSGTPITFRPPATADGFRRITALADLSDEYRRFAAYAQAAEAQAVARAGAVGELVQRAQRSAAFAGNLSQRNAADLRGVAHSVEEARTEVAIAGIRVNERLRSLESAVDAAERAFQSWNIARLRSVDARERATTRLAAARITVRRLTAVVGARTEAKSTELQRALRDLTHANNDVARFLIEIETADEQIERYDLAIAACEAAMEVARAAVDRQRACQQLISLAQDHVDTAAAVAQQTSDTLQRQQACATHLTKQTVLAVRADERAGRLLTTANSDYDDAQHHASETRRHLLDEVELLRLQTSRERNGFHYA
jgi:predicted  nucleic acid-binding Zn-ribbon protein